jgi:hypothetical protein
MESTDDFMMTADQIPGQGNYVEKEGHVNEKPMRKFIAWIRCHWSQ